MHNTKKVIELMEKAFSNYEDMQQKHFLLAQSALELLEHGKFNIADLTGIDYERQHSFNLLKKSIDTIQQLAIDENLREPLELYSQKLSLIIERERILQQLMQKLKNKLEERLDVLRVGKKGLAGYRKLAENKQLKYLDRSL